MELNKHEEERQGLGVCRRSLRLWGLGAALDNPGQPHCFQLEKLRLRELQGPPSSFSLEILWLRLCAHSPFISLEWLVGAGET